MKAKLVRIGNSRGVRIPANVIEQCGFADQVELRVEGDTLVIARARKLREGWEESFRAVAQAGDDEPIWPEFSNAFDQEEWTW
jgi:antitoxin MazE